MAKMRVYDLAIDLNLDLERTLELLREVGAEPRNHMSVVERVPARRVRQLLKQNPNAAIPAKRVSPLTVTTEEEKELLPAEEYITEESSPKQSPQVVDDQALKESVQTEPIDSSKDEIDIPISPKEETKLEVIEEPKVELEPKAKKAPKGEPKVKTEAPTKVGLTKKAETPKRKPSIKDGKAKPEDSSEKNLSPASPQKSHKIVSKDASPKSVQSGAGKSSDIKQPQQPTPDTIAKVLKDNMGGKLFALPEVEPTPSIEKQVKKGRSKGDKTASILLEEKAKSTKRALLKSKWGDKKEILDDSLEVTRKSIRRKPSTAKKDSTKKKAVPDSKPVGPVIIPESLTVQELAELLVIPATTIIKNLMTNGVMAAINQKIDFGAAKAVAKELGFSVKSPEEKRVRASHSGEQESAESELEVRPPVVTIMGHVDHGKTTLLDSIRSTHVVEQEAGGITQHIGAYQVTVNGKKITFLDTPGHEAFTSMRSRGAQITDIAVLIVAADDGVMPQTVEAINHAKAADVPIVVAINKIDRPGANPDRIKQQLTEYGLVPEEWGGDTVCVEISALKREGITDLLEMLLLVADIKELKANPNRLAQGVVIEAELDKNRGPVATVLVQNGTLKLGDSVVAGAAYGRIRAMFDEFGNPVNKATPSRPVAILGLSEVPLAGDSVDAVEDDKEARQLAQQHSFEKQQSDGQKGAGRLRLTELLSKGTSDGVKDLKLILKADVQGSIQALYQAVEKLSTPEVRVSVIHSAVGGINESDVNLAAACDALIIGYNVRPEPMARREAERVGVEIRLYRIIYEAIDEIKAAIEGLLDPTYQEVVLGRAEVRALFKVPNVGTVAGCYVTEGKIIRQAELRLIRNNIVIYEGKLAALKRFKDDVREVVAGYECGISLERFNDIKEGDIIEAFNMQEVK